MLRNRGKIEIKSKQGVGLSIDADQLDPGIRLQSALQHLLDGGDPKELDPKERAGLAKKRSLIGSGDNALIVRFDLKVIRIDEQSPLDLSKMRRSGPGSQTRPKKKSSSRTRKRIS